MNKTFAMSATLAARLLRLRRRYDACSPREKQMLLLAVLVVAAAVLFILVNAIASARTRLDRALPEAHVRLRQMQEQSAALAQQGSKAEAGIASLETLQAMARAHGIAADIRPESGGFALSGTADGAKVLEWLAGMQQQWRLRPQRVSFERVGGGVRFDVLIIAAQA